MEVTSIEYIFLTKNLRDLFKKFMSVKKYEIAALKDCIQELCEYVGPYDAAITNHLKTLWEELEERKNADSTLHERSEMLDSTRGKALHQMSDFQNRLKRIPDEKSTTN